MLEKCGNWFTILEECILCQLQRISVLVLLTCICFFSNFMSHFSYLHVFPN
uniref:Uncharacterized protein n=1 Tax=Rhizophora mucronata TaxID=61149 RepID=A0A2P2PR01_RHIMU